MIKPDKTKRETIFGSEFEVTVYPNPAQHKGKLSILTYPDNVKEVKEKLKIKVITSKYSYRKDEFWKISKDQIEFGLNLQLIDNLLKENAIKYIINPPDLSGNIEVIAKINIIKR